jgi:hypothetical protein
MCIPCSVPRQRLGKHVPPARNTLNNRRIIGRVCLWFCLSIPISLLRNNSVKTFPRQQGIVWCVVFYAVPVLLKERLVLPRTSCLVSLLHSLRRINWAFLLLIFAGRVLTGADTKGTLRCSCYCRKYHRVPLYWLIKRHSAQLILFFSCSLNCWN